MATKGKGALDSKPLCQFGANCYRRNPQHFQQFRHPKRKVEEEEEQIDVKKKKNEPKKIDRYFKPGKKSDDKEDEGEDEDKEPTARGSHTGPDVPNAEAGKDTNKEVEEGEEFEEEEDIGDSPASPVSIRENVKQKFMVEMPEDFYDFWEFCKTENPKKPEDALLKPLGFKLVGPYDILAGKHKGITKKKDGKRVNFLLHWRYYYDPPEFQTVIKGDDSKQFHMGYFRDDPNEMPVFVAENSAKVNSTITARGDNLFAAIQYYIDEKLKGKDTDSAIKSDLKNLREKINSSAKKKDYSLDQKSKSMKARDKKVVCKSFHAAGIVVPVDDNGVGYREVPETDADLKKMLKKIAASKTESERDKNFEPLQELMTLVQFANDECDYGEGLELGINLFCYGGEVFHSSILRLLPLAYELLNRDVFSKIITAHLRNRKQGKDLSQLE
ncbi:hypothetical protein CHS0354_026292 [Potamilus streckersoni]|uniref:PBZ-type domain-containing protein n=1 Tax=Potamilus streckersoni TaxID=2493646 RepID=A0AAE0TFY3_9BIVA|nr:hypothetical protein CHS0354_026292 [Potamilus streckersoni]